MASLANRVLLAGTGRTDITPPVGIAHVNWGARTHDRAEGIDLPLWATVLLLDDGAARTAIIDLDFLLIPTADCTRLRELAAEAAGLKPEHVRLSFTHTHAGPPWSADRMGSQDGLPGTELIPAYRAKMTDAIVAAARAAKAALRPSRVAAAHGASDISVNRRLRTESGRVIVAQNWEGETDPTMTLIRVDDLDEQPIATIVGYGTHPIVLAHQNKLISPDYPGTVKRTVEQLVGGTCMFLQGCAGDQIPREALTGDTGAARRMGTLLGLDAARAALRLRTQPTQKRLDAVVESGAPLGLWVEDKLPDQAAPLAVLSRKVSLPVRNYGPVEPLAAESESRSAAVRALDKTKSSAAEIADANYRAKRAAMDAHWAKYCAGRSHVEVEMHAIRIGDAALIGVPLEPFAGIGAEVRASSPLKVTQFAGYTNGWEGYVPTEAQVGAGGYEAEWATPYAKGAASALSREAKKLLDDLARG
jgi:Neutral/alkaline non-lysosomal ceramidase, N-terminal